MASNINSTDIDADYPVAGVDNDSQGFRDNFSTIKDSLAVAKTEITDLQEDTAKLNAANNFAGNTITNAVIKQVGEEVYNIGNVSASQNISYENGHYQTITVSNDVTLTLADWPQEDVLGKIRLVILGDGTGRTITWSVSGGGTIKKYKGHLLSDSTIGNAFPDPFEVSSTTDPIIVDFWTSDAGDTVYANYVGEFA